MYPMPKYLLDPFRSFDRTPTFDRQTQKQNPVDRYYRASIASRG